MAKLNWGMIQDGGVFESLAHAILYAEDAGTILFGRPGKDAGQDARSADGAVVYQAKYRAGMTMAVAVRLAKEESEKIKRYRQPGHENHAHWRNTKKWVLIANFSINPNDEAKWRTDVAPDFQREKLTAEFWNIEILENKLAIHPHIHDVFFGGENRVFIGLKETNNLLGAECIGGVSLEKPMVGRKIEIRKIMAFTESDETRILPVVGSGGVGKSRLLYEALVLLSRKGWRVLWSLSETMARSSSWFHLLNGSQPTCLVVDDLADPHLLRVIIEQLSPVERKNWMVIVSCHAERTELLQRFQIGRIVEKTIELGPLNESASHKLLQTGLVEQRDEAWLHAVFKYTHGVPGWLCMIMELANRGELSELPSKADDIAAIYVHSCLDALDEDSHRTSLDLLRWLAIWGVLKMEEEFKNQVEDLFSDKEWMPHREMHKLLQDLVATGLVRNWGIAKRMYAVNPLIIREHVLSDWLLEEDGGIYHFGAEGMEIVRVLVAGEVTAVDRILCRLSNLTRNRLGARDGFRFFKPIFDAMLTSAEEGDVFDQYRISDLALEAGAADPENALEVLKTIRENPKEDMVMDDPFLRSHTFTHASLILRIPWILFQLTEYVSEPNVARKYLTEFKKLLYIEEASPLIPRKDRSTRELIERLLRNSRNWELYARPAHDMVEAKLTEPEEWPYVRLLLESLLNPEKELTDLDAVSIVRFKREFILPDSPEWERSANLRSRIFSLLRTSTDTDIRSRLWPILANSHSQFRLILLHDYVEGAPALSYRTVLTEDLKACVGILRSPPLPIDIEEATRAREMWSFYLTYGREDDPVDLAHQCERLYSQLSKWLLHDFFRFGTDEEMALEAERIGAELKTAIDTGIFVDFFFEVKRYLAVTSTGAKNAAGLSMISKVADRLVDLFVSAEASSDNALTSFVKTVLGQAVHENESAWHFAVQICREHLRRIKKDGDETDIGKELEWLVGLTHDKTKFLYDLYSNIHPATTGILTRAELDSIVKHEKDFTMNELFELLGALALVHWETIQSLLRDRLNTMKDRQADTSDAMNRFIMSLHHSAKRYKWPANQIPTKWIIDMIVDFGLDGGLLESRDLLWLRDNSDFKISMSQLVSLVRSRIEFAQKPRPSKSFGIMPHDFQINEWCSFNETDPEMISAFHKFCQFILVPNNPLFYRIPKYVAQLDQTGMQVEFFIKQYIRDNAEIDTDTLRRLSCLASSYPDTSEAWEIVARPICLEAQHLRREEREGIYYGLSNKVQKATMSMPGVIPEQDLDSNKDAARMRDAEPRFSSLKEYHEWRVHCAEVDSRRLKELNEEIVG